MPGAWRNVRRWSGSELLKLSKGEGAIGSVNDSIHPLWVEDGATPKDMIWVPHWCSAFAGEGVRWVRWAKVCCIGAHESMVYH